MADIGIPHTVTSPNVWTGSNPAANVGEPAFLGGQIGTPHPAPTLGNTFTGSNPAANVGIPNGAA